jgi:hypothetical protein
MVVPPLAACLVGRCRTIFIVRLWRLIIGKVWKDYLAGLGVGVPVAGKGVRHMLRRMGDGIG